MTEQLVVDPSEVTKVPEPEAPGIQPERKRPFITEAAPAEAPADGAQSMAFINDVEVEATVELGRTVLPIREVLKLRRGSIVELDKLVGQPAELSINNTPLARGEIIVVNERFGFKITRFIASR